MGQSANCCKKQAESLSENYSEQIYAEYFGPKYAPQYQINTKFITHFQVYTNEEQQQRKEFQTDSTPNQTNQELPMNSIQQNEKYLNNINQILDSSLDLDSNNVNSSYENSINANRSILKKKDQQTSKHTKNVKFQNTDSKIKFSILDQKQLGQLLKRNHK
ncbi:unnamed protein product [Paramecium primaurelia]|uniref:Uncharacterized protein n=1 Tax=Paramecium primaurelia TaxID=5886 RepID=A0A8S1L7S3_PARPR|nr:unnamed protein product [Paramecium primaurelia]